MSTTEYLTTVVLRPIMRSTIIEGTERFHSLTGALQLPASNYQKRRILVICNDGDYFLRHRLFVVNRLTSMGHEVAVLAGGNPIRADLVKGWRYCHVSIERFGLAPLADLALAWRSTRAIYDFEPDAVHLITLKPAVFSGLASLATRALWGHPQSILITLPGLGRMLTWPKSPADRRYPLAIAVTLLALRLIAKVGKAQFSFETRHDYEFFEKRGIVDAKNGTVIEGAGVDPNQFYPATASFSRVKKRILFAGRLLKSKGLGIFLATARELAGRSDIEFLVAGMSDDRDPDALSPRDLASLDCIRFLGQVEDMPNLLRDCDIVCLPTRYGEGIPRILIEAAATGLASIASSHPGCREIVVEGVTGQILYGQSDSELARELSTAILQYLNSSKLLEDHKLGAYQYFRSRSFSQEAVSTHFCSLLGADQLT